MKQYFNAADQCYIVKKKMLLFSVNLEDNFVAYDIINPDNPSCWRISLAFLETKRTKTSIINHTYSPTLCTKKRKKRKKNNLLTPRIVLTMHFNFA